MIIIICCNHGDLLVKKYQTKKINNLKVNKDNSYKSKETRVVIYTCRYSSGHLIPIIQLVFKIISMLQEKELMELEIKEANLNLHIILFSFMSSHIYTFCFIS